MRSLGFHYGNHHGEEHYWPADETVLRSVREFTTVLPIAQSEVVRQFEISVGGRAGGRRLTRLWPCAAPARGEGSSRNWMWMGKVLK